MKDLWILPTICKMLTVHTSSVESGRCQKLNAADVKAAVVAQCGRCFYESGRSLTYALKGFWVTFQGEGSNFPQQQKWFSKKPKTKTQTKNEKWYFSPIVKISVNSDIIYNFQNQHGFAYGRPSSENSFPTTSLYKFLGESLHRNHLTENSCQGSDFSHRIRVDESF